MALKPLFSVLKIYFPRRQDLSIFTYIKTVMANNRPPIVTQDLPEKVYIGKDGDNYEYSFDDRLESILHGFYSSRNYFTLFDSIPEIFAPINEIASRVADANWQLKKTWNDQIDWNNTAFNRLFSKPNPLQGIRDFIWQAVVYEILEGLQLFFINKPSLLWDNDPDNISSWSNLPSYKVKAELTNVDPFYIDELSDLIKYWYIDASYNNNLKKQRFDTNNVLPVFNLSTKNGITDINKHRSLLKGADIAIRNLIPVYEARGIIYVKRGALGFVVSNKSDMSGKIALSKGSKEELRKEYQGTYGLHHNKSPLAFTDQPIDFIRTAMSIQELQPFTETLMDAIAIYKTLRVPGHLVPRETNSTFDNAKADMIDFYNSVIIPWANKYANLFTSGLGFDSMKRYVVADFSHIDVMSENKRDKAIIDKANGEVWEKRFKNGVCTLNDWIRSFGGDPVKNPLYDLTLFEMTEEQRQMVSGIDMKDQRPYDPNFEAATTELNKYNGN